MAQPCFEEAEDSDVSVINTLTTTLSDSLYGTPFSTLLTAGGWIFRSNSGGIPRIMKIDASAGRRFKVEELDMFFSHSWHAPWFLKYLILLLHFNGKPAVFTAFALSLLVFIIRLASREEPSYSLSKSCWKDISGDYVYEVGGGLIAFVVVLFTWHIIACVLLKRVLSVKQVFLDKVCIDQLDPVKKEQGIKQIGAYIKMSKSVLVAWDPTYVERLWCTFELSAYFHVHRDGAMTVLPCSLGLLIFIHFTLQVLSLMSRHAFILHDWDTSNTFWNRMVVAVVMDGPTMLVIMPLLREYMRKISTLKRQLEHFEARSAKCFCCSVGHIHPETGSTIPCDRVIVYDKIAAWYGNGHLDAGLQNFNATVRRRLTASIQKTLGSIHLSYTHAMILGLPDCVYSMLSTCSCPGWVQVLYNCAFLFLRGPIYAFIMVNTAKLFQWSRPSVVLEICAVVISALFGTLVFHFYEFARDIYEIRGHAGAIVALYAVEALAVSWIWKFQPEWKEYKDRHASREPPERPQEIVELTSRINHIAHGGSCTDSPQAT